MNNTEMLPDDILDHLASEIGSHVSALGPGIFKFGPGELGESLSLWMLPADKIAESQEPDALSEIAQTTGRWHHQLLFGGKALAFARSMPFGPDPASWRVLELFESPLADAIGAALEWLDAAQGEDTVVRLLVVPAYQVHVLWLVGDHPGEVYIVDRPQTFKSMPVGKLMSEQEFLQALRAEKPITGIS